MSIYSNGGCIGKIKTYDDSTIIPIRSTEGLYLVGQTSQQIAASTATTTQISFGSIPIEIGDFVIVAYATGSNTSRTIYVTSSEFTLLTNLFGNDTHDVNLYVGYAFLTNLVTPYYVSATRATADSGVVIVSVWRYVNTTTPIDTTPLTSVGTNSRISSFASINTTVPDTYMIVIGAGSLYTTTHAYSSSISNFISAKSDTNTAYRCEIGLGSVYINTPQSVDIPSFTSSSTTYDSNASVVFPIRSNFIKSIGANSGIWNLQTASAYV